MRDFVPVRRVRVITSPKLGWCVLRDCFPASPAILREVSQTHGRASGAGEGAGFTGGATGTRRPSVAAGRGGFWLRGPRSSFCVIPSEAEGTRLRDSSLQQLPL